MNHNTSTKLMISTTTKFKHILKKAALALLAFGVIAPAFAQKAKYHRFTFYYKQLPAISLDRGIETYTPKVILGYSDQINQMQNDYNMEVKAAEKRHAADMKVYEREYKLAQTRYKKELAEYNRQSTVKKLAGKELLGEEKPTFNPPEKPVYIKPEPPLIPKQHDTKKLEDKYVVLEGYTKGTTNPVLITYKIGLLETKPVKSVNKTRDVKKGDQTVKENYLEYTVQYRQPVTLVVESSLKGNRYNKIVPATDRWYSKRWTNTLPENYLEQIETLALDASLSATKIELNDKFGIMKKSLSAEIGYGEGRKHNYSDLDKAKALALSGYNNLYLNEDDAVKKLNSAMELWINALKEHNPNKKKARINRKVGVAVMMNVGAAALFCHQYDKSEEYFTQAEISDPTNAQKRVINFYRNLSRNLRERYQAAVK